MNAGGSAMVRGRAFSSNRGALVDEDAFTEQKYSLNYPRKYHEALKNAETVIRLIDKRDVEEDKLDTLDWAKPLNFQDSYEKTLPSKQTAEGTYLTGGTVLESNVIVQTGHYVRPANWELVFPVRFETVYRNKIHLGRC